MFELPEKAPLSPLRSVRRFCLECQGGPGFVRECGDISCALRPWRLPESLPEDPAAGGVLRGVRRHCLACAGNRKEIRLCAADSCALWPYRFGVHPATCRRVLRRYRRPKDLFLPGLEGLGKKR